MPIEPTIDLDQPVKQQIVIGSGQIQVLTGKVSWTGHVIKAVSVINPSSSKCAVELFPTDDASVKQVFIQVTWQATDIGKHCSIQLNVLDDKTLSADINVAEVTPTAKQAIKPLSFQGLGEQPIIAICMAMYAPKIEAFTRQIDSILCQTYQNWVLVICDDASPEADWTQIEAICQLDPRRIRLIKQSQNLGFYHNFERSLSHVPKEAEFIAFSDQDDIWYPDKLQKLVNKLQADKSSLVYSDMRIVHESGEVISPTYWQGRNNEYKDFDTVFMANTVTGAASLFERELLITLLPFPDRVGDAFHDHWVACSALSCKGLSYVDEALYDYIQYGDSVIGHCDFTRWTFSKRIKSLLKVCLRLLQPSSAKRWLGQKIGGGLAIYRGECLRLQTMSNTLKIRVPNNAKLSTLNLMNGGKLSIFKLLKLHIKILVSGRTTDDAEFRLAMGFISREMQKRR